MKLRILILILTCSNIAFAQAPKWDWVKGFGGNQQVNGNGITTDMNNNVYVVGGFICDTFFFGNSFFKKSSVNSSDYFLLKISSSGNVVWARKSYTLSDFNGGNAVAVDNQNNVIVGGNFNGHEIDFGNSIKLYNSSISQPGNGFSVDVFIIKYNASGAIKWTKGLKGNYDDEISFIRSDNRGNIFIAGTFRSDTLKVDTFNLVNHSTNSLEDMFIAKLDSNGNVIWAKNYGGIQSDNLYGFDIDNNSNSYLTGNLYNQYGLLTQFGNYSLKIGYFLLKLDSVGNLVWAQNNDYSSNLRGVSGGRLKCDVDNNILVSGSLQCDTAVFGQDTLFLKKNYNGNKNPDDFFITKYSPLGNVLWAKSYGGRWYDGVSDLKIFNHDLYINGGYDWDTLCLGIDTFINNNQDYDFFIAKLDSNGNPIWAKSVAGNPASEQVGVALSIDNFGSLYCLGMNGAGSYIDDSIYFDSTLLVSHSNKPYTDEIFLAKINSKTGAFINNLPQQNSNAILFPNPFSNSSTLKINSSQILTNACLSVVDLLGREVQSITNIHSNEIKIERNNLPSGIYFYHLTQNGMAICNGKMVVE